MALEDGDCFIDIGAHVGCFSLLAATLVGTRGRVISFEPEDLNYEQLRENIALNEFNHVRAYHLGLGSEREERAFFVNLDNDGGHALWDVGLHQFNIKSRATPLIKKMEVVSLDSILIKEQPEELKLIKIDTEGSELRILQGATDTIIKNKVPYVICEVNRFGLQQMGTNEQDLRSFMEDIGYDTYLMVNGQELRIMRLSKDQFVKSEYVFNLLFIRRDFDLAGHWV
jgi:FkbM family methyltransferase